MTSDYFGAIREGIARGRAGRHDVRRFRITWRESERASLGMKDNRLGSVHAPLEREWAKKGSFLLEWDTGELARGNLDAASLAHLPRILEAAWDSRYRDDDGACFLGPQPYPEVPLESEDAVRLLGERLPHLGETVRHVLDWGKGLGARNVSGTASVARGRRGVVTSEGLDVECGTTSFSYLAHLDGEITDAHSTRGSFEEADLDERLRFPGALFRATRVERTWKEKRLARIVLHPHVTAAFLDHFVFSNLGGQVVVQGQSPWSLADFRSGRQVFRADLRIGVNPHVPLSPGAYRFTGEGVPTEAQDFISGGRLERPLLDLKYARKAGMPPTTPPLAHESLVIEAGETRTWAEHLAEIRDGLLVLGVLGMHTQDRARGDYSLAAPTCAVLEGGGIVGKARVTLNDNFFSNLSSDSLRLVRFPNQHLPGLAFETAVAPDKGE